MVKLKLGISMSVQNEFSLLKSCILQLNHLNISQVENKRIVCLVCASGCSVFGCEARCLTAWFKGISVFLLRFGLVFLGLPLESCWDSEVLVLGIGELRVCAGGVSPGQRLLRFAGLC